VEEHRWIALNDNSSWWRVDGETRESVLHIA
jgi:hypothetical protein